MMARSERAEAPNLAERALILVRGSRDGQITRDVLERAGVSATVCSSIADLCEKLEEGGAVTLLAEEVLTPAALTHLAATLARQPPWSDFPMVVFSAVGANDPASEAVARVLGNVTFLERPVRSRSMLAAVHAAIRSRHRQYEGRRAIESRDTFLAMLGHELRNPLGAISLAIELVDQRLLVASKELAIIDRQTKHLTRLVDDLLDVARITHDKVVLKPERLNVVAVVRSAFDALEARARDQGLSYAFPEHADEIWVRADRQRLEQVFANLLTNAIKYTPSGGKVTVAVREEDDQAVVDVVDNGIGIAAGTLDKMFEPFAQADRSLDRTEGGMGLGLAVVRKLVHLHGGTVEAESAGVGHGSRFTLRLPIDRTNMPAAVGSSRSLEDLQTKRVVVVEDSPDIRDLLVELLQREGHEVMPAEDGPGGLETILHGTPDIAFIDLGLPGFDGLEVARLARAQGSTARLVAVTGYGQPEDRRRAAEAGFDDHLTKPVVERDVRAAMLRLEHAHG